MKFFLRHLEIILTFAGLIVIFGAAAGITPAGTSYWQVAALTAILVGVLHGGLFFVLRRRRREVRQEAIADIRRMLQETINNQLAVIQAMSALREARPEETQRACDYIARSVKTISEAVEHLSEESLRTWHAKYEAVEPGGPAQKR